VYGEKYDGMHYYCQDANYNVTAVVDATGSVLERYDYTPYGEVTFLDPSFIAQSSSIIANQHLYTGRELDPETGLQLNRHRYYVSHIGRWTARDPIEYGAQDFNLYCYVADNPANAFDGNGLASEASLRMCRLICNNRCRKWAGVSFWATCITLCEAGCKITCPKEKITEPCRPPTAFVGSPNHVICSYSCGRCGIVKRDGVYYAHQRHLLHSHLIAIEFHCWLFRPTTS
jgi:RHS repeat-associated protein